MATDWEVTDRIEKLIGVQKETNEKLDLQISVQKLTNEYLKQILRSNDEQWKVLKDTNKRLLRREVAERYAGPTEESE